jgi:serine/threonine-protein kinase HipA
MKKIIESPRCLYCYDFLSEEEKEYHKKCAKKFFGTDYPASIEYDRNSMEEIARQILIKSASITGVQPKLSLDIEKKKDDPKRSRFTIVGLKGNFVLKPPADNFPGLPENEDLTMHLASAAGFRIAEHTLVRLSSGELAYLTKRFDRINGNKLQMEDMCQLTERLTEDKYRGSVEKIGKLVYKYSSAPGLDMIRLFEVVLFSFITGNADMHLKNYALLTDLNGEIYLSPAYDLLCTKLLIPEDKEESALTINGKKNDLRKSDFDKLANTFRINPKAIESIYKKFNRIIKIFGIIIDTSFISNDAKSGYKSLITGNSWQLELI